VKEMKKSTKERVLDYIKEFGSITLLEAYRDLGTFSLREAIRDLKRDGYDIRSKYETSLNRWGTKTNYKRYWLE
jgi:hypothetical protein